MIGHTAGLFPRRFLFAAFRSEAIAEAFRKNCP
jgi:hypothetical protein